MIISGRDSPSDSRKPFGMGIYTLLVYSEHGGILLNRQISAPCFFTVPAVRDETIHAYFLHNQWIGLDEHIDFANGRVQVVNAAVANGEQKPEGNPNPKPKSRTKRSGKTGRKKDAVSPDSSTTVAVPATQSASKQDEMDLLNFISWEDTPHDPLPPQQSAKQSVRSQKRKQAPLPESDMVPPKRPNTGLSLCSFLDSMFS